MSSPSSLLERVRRARVVPVLVVYLGAAWIVLRVADVLRDTLALPSWVPGLAFLLLAVGLLVIMATAWVQSHPDTAAAEEAGEVPADWEIAPGEALASLRAGEMPHLTWGRATMGGAVAFGLLFGGLGLYAALSGRTMVPAGPVPAPRVPPVGLADSLLARGRIHALSRLLSDPATDPAVVLRSGGLALVAGVTPPALHALSAPEDCPSAPLPDERFCVAYLTVAAVRHGDSLVVPLLEANADLLAGLEPGSEAHRFQADMMGLLEAHGILASGDSASALRLFRDLSERPDRGLEAVAGWRAAEILAALRPRDALALYRSYERVVGPYALLARARVHETLGETGEALAAYHQAALFLGEADQDFPPAREARRGVARLGR